jgi:hypothetical protein
MRHENEIWSLYDSLKILDSIGFGPFWDEIRIIEFVLGVPAESRYEGTVPVGGVR